MKIEITSTDMPTLWTIRANGQFECGLNWEQCLAKVSALIVLARGKTLATVLSMDDPTKPYREPIFDGDRAVKAGA